MAGVEDLEMHAEISGGSHIGWGFDRLRLLLYAAIQRKIEGLSQVSRQTHFINICGI